LQKDVLHGSSSVLTSGAYMAQKKSLFDSIKEHRMKPNEFFGDQLLQHLMNETNVKLGKEEKTRKRKRKENELNWKKKCIFFFFNFPYWSTLKPRHNLDVMHIEKNICDSVLGTLLTIIDGKTKDTFKARQDLCEKGICKDLYLKPNGRSTSMPHENYTLSKAEKTTFLDWLKGVKFLDGYSSTISRCVNVKQGKISRMKSHDCHVFLQNLLPVAICPYLTSQIRTTLIELSFFFKELCARTLRLDVLKRMKEDIPVILCKLEKIFPSAFFVFI
jgi:hypothetical protein